MAENPRATQIQTLTPTARSIPDIPSGEISQTALREFMSAVKNHLETLTGDGAASALTPARATQLGLLAAPNGGTSGRDSIGDRFLVWNGYRVPAYPRPRQWSPGSVQNLEVRASFGGALLTWDSPDRTGGQFEVWRSKSENMEGPDAVRVGVTTGTQFVDNTTGITVGKTGALEDTFYYRVRSFTNPVNDGEAVKYGEWSSHPNGIPWVLDPNTFATIVADNIVAGNLRVLMNLAVGGALISGKSLDSLGRPNDAAGFYLNGNEFYFSGDGGEGGPYIRWSNGELAMSGDLYATALHGGSITGATISGGSVYSPNFVYSYTMAGPGDAYRTEFVAPTDDTEFSPTHVYWLTSKAVWTSLPTVNISGYGVIIGNGYTGRAHYFSGDITEVDCFWPYNHADADTKARARTQQVEVVVEITMSAGTYTSYYSPSRQSSILDAYVYYELDDGTSDTLMYNMSDGGAIWMNNYSGAYSATAWGNALPATADGWHTDIAQDMRYRCIVDSGSTRVFEVSKYIDYDALDTAIGADDTQRIVKMKLDLAVGVYINRSSKHDTDVIDNLFAARAFIRSDNR